MKFVISKGDLLELIGAMQNVVAPRVSIPIIANVLVEAKNDELILTATDLTFGVRCFKPAKILQEGSAAVPARRFFQLIRELPECPIEISSKDGALTEIVAGASRFKLHGMDPRGFPSLPELAGAAKFTLPQSTLRQTLYRTAFAVSRDDNRLALTGVYCHLQGGVATFVGTDGKKLSRTPAHVAVDSELNGSYILPLKSVEEIIRLSKDSDESATFYLLEDKVAVEVGNAIVITKLLAGDYPDVDQVIPKKSEFAVDLHREELASLLRQVSLFTNENSHSARFSFAEGELTLSANTAEVGEGKVSMPANYSGDKFDIAFNPYFFLDILRRSDDETVKIALTDSYNPGVITDSSDGLFVLMPMRLNDQG